KPCWGRHSKATDKIGYPQGDSHASATRQGSPHHQRDARTLSYLITVKHSSSPYITQYHSVSPHPTLSQQPSHLQTYTMQANTSKSMVPSMSNDHRASQAAFIPGGHSSAGFLPDSACH